MNIRRMKPSDIGFAARRAIGVGWVSTTRQEFEASLAYDPHGCFIAEEDGQRAGLCIATNYGESGFVGNLIVVEEMRGRGFGRRLLEHAVEYLQSCGTRNVLLDGVPAAVSLYERVGFHRVCRSLRFAGKIQGQVSPAARAIRARDLEAIGEVDREAFGADRRFFLERRWSLDPELGKVLEREGEIVGFILGRHGKGVVGVGPWIVKHRVQQVSDLLRSLAAEADGRPLVLGVLETNAEAVATIRSLGMRERQNPSLRMLLGDSGRIGLSNQCYAIGALAKG